MRPLLPASVHLLGGLCFSCVHRSAPGVVEHQSLGAVSLGYHSGPASEQIARLAILEEGAGLFSAAGVTATVMANLDQARWQKLVWNVPYNGLSVLLDADTSALMVHADSRALIQAIMQEVVQGAAACGHQLPVGLAEKLFASTEQVPNYLPSMHHDWQQRRPMELQAIYAAPLLAAAQAGCELPRMQSLYQALRFIDSRNQH